jgi:hypothetical protein
VNSTSAITSQIAALENTLFTHLLLRAPRPLDCLLSLAAFYAHCATRPLLRVSLSH